MAGGALIGGIGGWLSGGGPSDAELAQQRAAMAERAHATALARSAADGAGPSAAESLLSIKTGQANDLAMSQAKGMAGANPALAATLASNAAAQTSQYNTQAAAALRAQEMNEARAQYLQATGANVQAGAAMDQQIQAQKEKQMMYNNSLYNSTMSGLAGAAGKIAGSEGGYNWETGSFNGPAGAAPGAAPGTAPGAPAGTPAPGGAAQSAGQFIPSDGSKDSNYNADGSPRFA
jgi:hypothetical protein